MKKITGLEFLEILFNLFIGAVLLVDAIENGSNGYIYASVVCLLASFISGLCAQRGHEITKLTQEYADVNHQRLQALKEKDEADQQLSLLRQKYSRTNQPRSGGKFVKKVQERGSAEDVFNENVNLPVTNSDVFAGKLCGYCTGVEYGQWDEFIIGLNNEKGFIRIDKFDIINKKYKSYKYCSYQDILNAKNPNP